MCFLTKDGEASGRAVGETAGVSKNDDETCIRNEEFCIKTDEICRPGGTLVALGETAAQVSQQSVLRNGWGVHYGP